MLEFALLLLLVCFCSFFAWFLLLFFCLVLVDSVSGNRKLDAVARACLNI